MAALRRNLRLLATTWLVCQVAWLAALGPHACCMSERPPEKACHDAVPQPPPECRLVGSCDGPLGALLTQFANSGLLADSTAAPYDALEDSAPALIADSPAGQFEPPDPPPPRA